MHVQNMFRCRGVLDTMNGCVLLPINVVEFVS